MRLLALFLLALTALLPFQVAAQSTLNKCIEAGGKVTYSNLPCRNAQEVRKLEIDPAPPPQPVRPQAVQKPAPSAPAVPSASPEPPTPVAQPEPTAPATPRMQVSPAAPKAPAIAIEPTPKRIEVRPPHTKPAAARASANQCDALTEQLGRVFDKMDGARRVGATQEQMNTWNEEVKELERKKQQSGCF